MEHKTTSGYQGITSSFLKSFKPNLQLRGYVKGVTELRGPEYTSVLLDLAWVGRGEPKSGEAFLRYEEPVETWELEEFEMAVNTVAQEIAVIRDNILDVHEAYTPDWSRCHDFGGCPFRPVCSAAPSIRERIIAESYELKPVREEKVDGLE